MKVCVLGSGSTGNCLYVSGDRGGILLDAGLSGRELIRRLAMIGVEINEIHALCLSHGHADHAVSLGTLHRRYGLPVFANEGTIQSLSRKSKTGRIEWMQFTTGSPFVIEDLELYPFSIPHDCFEPVGFVIRHGDTKVVLATDMGVVTDAVRIHARDCHCAIIEFNHDEGMVRESARPWSLKQRILGRHGHLSNGQAASLLQSAADGPLQAVFLAHLSEQCNRPDLALKAACGALQQIAPRTIALHMTYPDRPSVMLQFDAV